MSHLGLICVEILFVSSVIFLLYRLRPRLSLAPLYIFVGSNQYIQTVLASSVYVPVIGGQLVSPGSVVLFTSSLFAILLVYIKEDIASTRTLIYGIVLSNLTITALSQFTQTQLSMKGTVNALGVPEALFGVTPRFVVVGTAVLILDSILIVVLYEFLFAKARRLPLWLRIVGSLLLILYFDGFLYMTGTFLGNPAYGKLLLGNLLGKTFSGVFYGLLLYGYLVLVERRETADLARPTDRSRDIFSILTYRQRYEVVRTEKEALVVEVAERKRIEDALRESEERYRRLVDASPDAIVVHSGGQIVFVNPAGLRLLGAWTPEQIVGRPFADFLSPGSRASLTDPENALTSLERGAPLQQARLIRLDRRDVPVEVAATPLTFRAKPAIQVVARDITERVKLEEQLFQAQKMEAVGQMAGGIAHDFNNLLTAIAGYSELLLGDLPPGDPRRQHAEEIRNAGGRAASLTQQLLAFSRQQVLEPKVLDLNAALANLEKMLSRVLGEDIELVTSPGPGLWTVKADPGQIEQVIVNLTVNARDAMPHGGKLTIETANVELDDNYGRTHVPAAPGQYVLLAVADTGSGMSPEVQAHLFEPFFTTKEVGKGTGLGLSTAYGIVKQSGGYLWAYSEPGHGTTFKIYLPRFDALPDRIEPRLAATTPSPAGSETILLVEDEAEVRSLVRKLLRMKGYTLIEAGTPMEALSISEHHEGNIDLMLTDVVMPGMSGRELKERLAASRSTMRVLYMSGYPDNAIVHHGVLAPGTFFLQKPFTPDALARKVREVLDSCASELVVS